MGTQFGVEIKTKIMTDVKEAIKQYEAKPDMKTRFGEPMIGYADTANPIFDMYFTRTICEHPKRIYRPGNTVVVHFVPYEKAIAQSNQGGTEPSEEWIGAFNDSMWLSMRLNGVIRDALDTVGRLSSCTNTPTDWDKELCREEWSHKLAAYAAGMGHFGPAGSFVTKEGFAGRFGSIITDGHYADAFEPLSAEALEILYGDLMKQCRYQEAGVKVSEQMVAACPGGAISADGIDRKLCQAHCMKIDKFIPSPEVCGKCFYYE